MSDSRWWAPNLSITYTFTARLQGVGLESDTGTKARIRIFLIVLAVIY
jgi:hypothetical protein